MNDKYREVLVRVPGKPINSGVELIAPLMLRDYFGIDEGDEVNVVCEKFQQ